MNAPILQHLSALVLPFDLPRSEAALIQHTNAFSSEECGAAAAQMAGDDCDNAVVRVIFRRWADVDLPAATKALRSLTGNTARLAAKAISARLLRSGSAIARQWAVSLQKVKWKAEPLLEMRPGVVNPLAEAARLRVGTGSLVERAVWEVIITSLCSHSAVEALAAWREANACGVNCRSLVRTLVAAMADEPEMAVRFIQELGDRDAALEALSAHLQNIAAKSPQKALELLKQMECGENRDRLLNEVLYEAPALVGRFCSLYSDSASDFECICMKHSLVSLGTEAATAQMVEFPELIPWYRLAWEVFIDLLKEPGEEPRVRALLERDLPGPLLSAVASALAASCRHSNAGDAAELLRRFGPADDYAVTLVAEALGQSEGMDAAAAFIADMPGDRRFDFSGAMRGATARNPGEALEWCRRHWESAKLVFCRTND
jgi:hypothetical protein